MDDRCSVSNRFLMFRTLLNIRKQEVLAAGMFQSCTPLKGGVLNIDNKPVCGTSASKAGESFQRAFLGNEKTAKIELCSRGNQPGGLRHISAFTNQIERRIDGATLGEQRT